NGKATFWGPGMGACGWTRKETDLVAALPIGLWNKLGGTITNGNIVCGHKLKVSNGKVAVTVEITDQCGSCEDVHLDLSPAAFDQLGPKEKGILDISWGWIGPVPHQ
ncbi:hypothetical protein BDZ90DRAFT_217216, partial [Jaminaea rosea]